MLLLSSNASAQFNLTDSNNVWGTLQEDCFNCAATTRYYTIGKDISYAGKTFTEITATDSNGIVPGPVDSYFRKEGEKYYWVDELDIAHYPNDEYLIYDFGLQVGDTFFSPVGSWSGLKVVSTVDSILFLGNYRKRIKFNGTILNSPDDWIEGKGNDEGIPNYWSFSGPSVIQLLTCYWYKGMIYVGQLNSFGRCDVYIVGIEEELKNTDFDVYPVPASDFLTIEILNPSFSFGQGEVYSIIGTLIHQFDLQGELTKISVREILPGNYFLRISDGTKSAVRPIIISTN